MFLQKRIGSAAPFCIVIVLLQQEITTKAFTSVTQDHFYSTNAIRQTRQISYFIICKGATFHHFDMKGCSIESKSAIFQNDIASKRIILANEDIAIVMVQLLAI